MINPLLLARRTFTLVGQITEWLISAQAEVWSPGENPHGHAVAFDNGSPYMLGRDILVGWPEERCRAGHRYFDAFTCTKPPGHDGEHGYAGCFWRDAEATDPATLGAADSSPEPPTGDDDPVDGIPPLSAGSTNLADDLARAAHLVRCYAAVIDTTRHHHDDLLALADRLEAG